jgi:hypothetical protein
MCCPDGAIAPRVEPQLQSYLRQHLVDFDLAQGVREDGGAAVDEGDFHVRPALPNFG